MVMRDLKPLAVPVIFLMTKSAVKNRVRGIHLGAEDYMINLLRF